MLSLRPPSSNHRRRSVTASPAAALILLHRVSGSNTDTDAYHLFKSQIITRTDERAIDWEAFAAELADKYDSTSDLVSPVASPTVPPSASPTTEPTAKPTQSLDTVGNNGSPPQFFPLGLCEGDCDNDDECAGNLICHQRGRSEIVPGCAGGLNEGEPTDFCVLPNATATGVVASPTVSPVAVPTAQPTTTKPTPLATTANPTSLPTSQPTTVTPTTSIPTTTTPTPLPTTNSTIMSTTSQPTTTAQPTAKPTQLRINRVGNDGSPTQVYPLGLCQGDCDNDDDCAGDLICHQRDRNEAVPGCAGGQDERGRTDYCVAPPTASPSMSFAPSHQPTISVAPSLSHAPSHQPSFSPTNAPTMDASAPVRLRLYWTRSSRWQETKKETWWCLQCRSGACKTNSIIEVDRCSRSSTRQKFQYYKQDRSFRPMTDPSLCFEENGWDRETNPIKLKRCNGSSRQQWKGFKEKKGDPFEFKSGRNSGYCMTQAHHPKAHERVFPQQCRRARNHRTNKWVVY